MKLAHINIRSMFTHFNEFSFMVQENSFDAVAVTETWLSDGVSDDAVGIPGYRLFRRDRPARGGGVGVYVIESLLAEVMSFDFEVSAGLEVLFIKLKLKSATYAVGVFYRPPNVAVGRCIGDIDSILSRVTPCFDEVFCMGDFNVNFFNLNNPMLNCFESYGFTQIIDEPTRVTETSATLIDPIFVTNSDKIISFGALDTDGISDHRMVFVNIKIKIVKMKPRLIKVRGFKNFNYTAFVNDLYQLNWCSILQERDIDEKISLFNCLMLGLFDRHAPVRQIRVTKPRAPWMTDVRDTFIYQNCVIPI